MASSEPHLVVDAKNRIGEKPVWCDRSQKLWWIDIYGPAVLSLDPETGKVETFTLPGKTIGYLQLAAGGTGPSFVIAQEDGLFAWTPGGERRFLVSPEPGAPDMRLNDGVCDREGRLWLGSMREAERKPDGSLWCVEPDGTVSRHAEGITIPNSLAVSSDGGTLYFTDTMAQVIWAYDCAEGKPSLTNRRVFVDVQGQPGRPDGATVDAEGFLWSAEFSGHRVVRYAPDGRVDRVVELPVRNVTCVGFGGPALDRLYISTASFGLDDAARAAQPLAGGLFMIEPGVRGLPEPRFAFNSGRA